MDLTVLKDGTLVSCSKDKTIRFWDPETHESTGEEPLYDRNLNAVATMPNGDLVVAKDNMIKFFNH